MRDLKVHIRETVAPEGSFEALLQKYGGPVPRYTSYPTAPHFHDGVTPATVEDWLKNPGRAEASLYIHMAYCKSLCLYCGCNMKVTNNMSTVSAYVDVLLQEMDQVARLLPERLKLTTVHWGGGTPSYAPLDDLERTFKKLKEHFDIAEGAEISMEIDPRQLHADMPKLLGKLGFNRASLGVQDTNQAVQEAIRRVQPQLLNKRAVESLRAAGVQNINVDLLYGLPRQSIATMKQTVADMMELRPERIALFGYAHVPWMKKHQAVLEQYDLPDAKLRVEIFETAVEELTKAGYVAVGIDHFCLPTDSMAIAAKQAELKRNFMGYTTDDSPLLLGFGASAISQYPQGYAQNVTAVHDYTERVKAGQLATARGIAVKQDDMVRRRVIESLLCNMAVEAGDIDLQGLVAQPEKLEGMVADGLAVWDGAKELRITEEGRPFARAVAACFDTYLKPEAGRHSRAV